MVVFGILLPNGEVDKMRTSILVDIALPLEVTCHRGGGVTFRNLKRILTEIPSLKEVHMALQGDFESEMNYKNSSVFMGVALTTPECLIKKTDPKQVKGVVKLLNKL
ncbi:hypothetical protein HDU92_001366 [Lobulomyces angularis]|nr:hypothetical protein HDU92_001366 [Lobulomyces angularis]